MFQQLKSWCEANGLSEGGWPRLKAAIEFYETFSDNVLVPDTVHPHEFEESWPNDLENVPEYFRNPAQYRAWRSILISGLEAYSRQMSQKSASKEDAKDDWLRLRDWCSERGLGSVHESKLLALRRVALKREIAPSEVTQDWAEQVQKGLDQSQRAIFRSGIGAFDKARSVPEIREEFGLTETPIGKLQFKLSPNEEHPLPPRLKADSEEWIALMAAGEPIGFRGRLRKPVAEATLRQYRFAFAWYWRCFAFAFPNQLNPETATLARQFVLETISEVADNTKGLRIKPSMKREYLAKILPYLHQWNPKLVQPGNSDNDER